MSRQEFDLVIRGGTVVDGRHRDRRADVGLVGGAISAIGDLVAAPRTRTLDADGLVVAPGFIDVHTHGDLVSVRSTRSSPLELAPLMQGVTTQIVGNCGFSVFGASDADPAPAMEHVRGLFGGQAHAWSSYGMYRKELEAVGLPVNLASLVGHGTVARQCRSVHPNSADGVYHRALAAAVASALRDGAIGLSSGLVYTPGTDATTDELMAACEPLAAANLPYVTHVRGETEHVLDAIDEAMRIAERAGVALHISHHKIAGRNNWGASRQTLEKIDAMISMGRKVTLDVYPYTAASTSFHTLLPLWVRAGQFATFLDRIRRPETRESLRSPLASGGTREWENMIFAAGWDGVIVANAPGRERLNGRSLGSIARASGQDPLDAALDLQVECQAPITVLMEVLSDDDVERILRYPATMIGSDGIPLPGKPHPRWAGSFARVLSEYVRRRPVLDLGEAIWKMSGLPASTFGIKRRGAIQEGYAADLVVLDPDAIRDRASYDQPLAPPEGIEAVVVGGELAVESSQYVGTRSGVVL